MAHRAWMPIRWMSNEAIQQGRYSEASDVWSFGVTLWEIYSYGKQPYEGYANHEVINMISTRNLLECPQNCPTNIYRYSRPVFRSFFFENKVFRVWCFWSNACAFGQSRSLKVLRLTHIGDCFIFIQFDGWMLAWTFWTTAYVLRVAFSTSYMVFN